MFDFCALSLPVLRYIARLFFAVCLASFRLQPCRLRTLGGAVFLRIRPLKSISAKCADFHLPVVFASLMPPFFASNIERRSCAFTRTGLLNLIFRDEGFAANYANPAVDFSFGAALSHWSLQRFRVHVALLQRRVDE
jgi:hypothetical protein